MSDQKIKNKSRTVMKSIMARNIMVDTSHIDVLMFIKIKRVSPLEEELLYLIQHNVKIRRLIIY